MHQRHFPRRWFLLACLASSTLAPSILQAGPPADRPKLVVWIIVDQLRGDMPWRYLPESAAGGLRQLRRRGTWCRNAHFEHATTFTAVGHATLLTGAYVPQHGIAGNEWRDPVTGRDGGAVEDDRCTLLAPGARRGCSPHRLTSTTLSDELVLASAGRSRVFTVSGKDRAAVLTAGRLGKAFWFDPDSGRFVTSSFYENREPAWAARFNDAAPAEKYREASWDLRDDRAGYLHADRDDRACEKGYRHLGATFPHRPGAGKPEDFLKALTYTPFADELAAAFARQLVEAENLGGGDAVDMLILSLSATDHIGHAWGPESLEAEDNVRRLDDLLAGFLTFLDGRLGLARCLIVLTADHGMDDVPECAATAGFHAGRLDPAEFLAAINRAVRERFRIDRDVAVAFWSPSVYFDQQAVAAAGLDGAAVERIAVEALMRMPGVALAAARSDLLAGRVPLSPLAEPLRRSFHPTRSGNVLIVPEPHWYLYHETHAYAAMHGTPWAYDTFVPVIVAGPGIPVGVIDRTVSPASLAPTLASLLGIKPPSGCVAPVIPELLGGAPDP